MERRAEDVGSKISFENDSFAISARQQSQATHAGASPFIEQGWPPKKIQTMVGHSSITLTYDVYGHLFHDPAKDVDLMGEMERGLRGDLPILNCLM